jgi:hypothetical protein
MRYLLALLMIVTTGCLGPQPLGDDAPVACPEPPPAVYATEPVTSSLPMPAIKVWIEPGTDNLEEVRAGVAGWAEVFRGVRVFEYVDAKADAHVAIMEIGPYGGTCQPGGLDQTLVLGCVHQTGGLWDNRSGEPMPLYLISGNVDQAVKLTVMHELGHLFGLTHQDGGLMWGPAPPQVLSSVWECPDAVSVDRLAERFELTGLHSCELPAQVAAL